MRGHQDGGHLGSTIYIYQITVYIYIYNISLFIARDSELQDERYLHDWVLNYSGRLVTEPDTGLHISIIYFGQTTHGLKVLLPKGMFGSVSSAWSSRPPLQHRHLSPAPSYSTVLSLTKSYYICVLYLDNNIVRVIGFKYSV